jgi:hypothetical protein
MKFKYIGDCDGFSFRGIKFPIGVSVDVTDQEIISKLENNSHYEACFSSGMTKSKPSKAKKATPEKLVVNNGDSSGHTE